MYSFLSSAKTDAGELPDFALFWIQREGAIETK